jgi:hypothetical protein
MNKNLSIKFSLVRGVLLALLLNLSLGLSAQQLQYLGDNMGSHIATKDLNMNAKNIVNAAGLVIGSASFTNPNVILDINSLSKVMVIPRITNITTLTGTIDNGSMAYDVATNKFYIRENNAWSSFGDFNLASGQVMLGNASNRAVAVALSGDVTVSPIGVTTIGDKKVTVAKLATAGATDANKVFATNMTSGNPELISKNDLAIPKYSTAERDALYTNASPAPDNTIIYNTTLRLLQIFNASISPAPGAWVAPGTPSASNLPVVSTAIIDAVSAKPDTAFAGGSVTSEGATPVTAKGVCWKTSSGPTVTDFVTVNGSGTGTFNSTLYGLLPNQTYYVRAYATNGNGTSYGQEVTFTAGSAKIPVLLQTQPATAISANRARSGGEITNAKGSNITSKGVVWSTSSAPTIDLTTKTAEAITAPGTGAFVSDLTGLIANTTYYVRAYATNAIGTAYGTEISFKTAVASAPTVTTTAPVISGASVSSGGNVTTTGGSTVISRGIVWSTTNPPPISSTTKTTNGAGTGTFTSNLSSLTAGTTYYLRAYATNNDATGYGEVYTFIAPAKPTVGTYAFSAVGNTTATVNANVIDDGGLTTARGVIWSTSSGALYNASNTTTQTSNGTGAGTYTSSITGLTALTTYYIKSYATNALGTSYGTETRFTTSGTTSGITAVTAYIPVGITSILGQIYGGQGGGSNGGLGGFTTVRIPVSAGQVLSLSPGGKGANSSSGVRSAATNNGGGTGTGTNYGSGGGCSAILVDGTITAIAGGGGGSNDNSGGVGAGGGLTGNQGAGGPGNGPGGGGGTQTSGGTTVLSQYNGSYLQGGNSGSTNAVGGGGGGGYYGGAGGNSSGGGGGSGYIGSLQGSTQTGVNTGAGYISITYP